MMGDSHLLKIEYLLISQNLMIDLNTYFDHILECKFMKKLKKNEAD